MKSVVDKKVVRIFVSSPGDVGVERVIADRVIRRLQREYRNSIDIEPILWENLPLTPTATFQDGIDALLKSAPIDVAIFILGARLGSSPGRNYVRPDGKPYGSGTEYEFDMMMESYHRSGRPLILFYKKDIPERQILSGRGISEVENAISQFKAVNQFVEEHFYDKDKGAYIAYHLLDDKSVGFEQRLETHLREIIEKLLPTQGAPRWNGNPYKGLLPFGIEDEAIFFGRSTVLNDLERELFAQCSSDEPRMPSVIVSGESGAGKSSFVKAGLLPDLLRTTVFPKSRVEYRIATPGQLGSHLCDGLWQMLKEILPVLPELPQQSKLDERFVEEIAAALKNAIQKRIEETGLRPVPLLMVDQLEEVFTHADIAEGGRTEFAKLLSALQKSNAVLLVFTIRSDFYQNLTSAVEWLTIKKDALLCDLPRMTVDEYKQVITAPAELAGYKWERDERSGRRLDEVILDDAVKQQVPLPLLEFTLSDIVERSSDGRPLSFAAYKVIGGIGGAIQKRADEFFASLSSDEKAAFYRLLGSLITVNPADGKYVRSEILVKTVEPDKTMRKVLNVFVSNRLFSVSGNEIKEATVTIAHEALISQWKVIQDWLEREHQLIQARRECEAAMVKWESNNCARELLLSSPSDLAQAEDLLLCWGSLLPDRLKKFINLSFKRKYRCRAWWTLVAGILLVLSGMNNLLLTMRTVLAALDYVNVEMLCPRLSGILGMIVIGAMFFYSAIHRFRGTAKFLRSRKDVFIYGPAVAVVGIATVVSTMHLNERTQFMDVVVLFLPFIIAISAFASLLATIWHARRRMMRKTEFVYRNSGVDRILSMGMWMFLILLCVDSMYQSYSDVCVVRTDYDCILGKWFSDDPLIRSDEVFNMLQNQRENRITKMFASADEAAMYLMAQTYRGYPEIVLDDEAARKQAEGAGKYVYEQLIFEHYRIADDLGAQYKCMCEFKSLEASEEQKLRMSLFCNRIQDARQHFALVDWASSSDAETLLCRAHGMLFCSNNVNTAEALYREVIADDELRRRVINDFAFFKSSDQYRKRIEVVERDINLESVPIVWESGNGTKITSRVDIRKELPWLEGVWQWQKDDVTCVDMTIDTSRRINCKSDERNNTELSKRRLYRMRIVRCDDIWNVVLYDTFAECFTVGTLRKIDDATIEIAFLYGDDVQRGQIRTYKKIREHEQRPDLPALTPVNVVGEIVKGGNAEKSGLKEGDIVCRFGAYDILHSKDLGEMLHSIDGMKGNGRELIVARKMWNTYGMSAYYFSAEPIGAALVQKDITDKEKLLRAYQAFLKNHEDER